MPGRRGTETRLLDGEPLTVRLPLALRTRIDNAAADANLSAAAFLRQLAVAATRGTPDLAVPSSPRRPIPALPSDDVRAIAALREAVGELAGAMVRAAVMARTDAADVLHREIEAALPGIRRAALDLDALKARLMAAPPP